jgi:N-acetylglutamate synthase/N-acetylornithine aminotransferase
MGMKVDTVQDVRRNTQFTVASMMKGTGILRPEMVKLITAGATANAADERTEIASLLSTTTAGNWTGGFAAEYAVA